MTVKKGQAAYEQDAVAHDKPQFRWPLLACLLHVAFHKNALSGRPLHILDFGGSLGSVYFQHRVFLETVPSILWSIVERPHVVQCGNAEFSDEKLHYFNTIMEAAARAPIDAALFSGSLEYLETPYDVLGQIAALGIEYLILDQLHVTGRTDDQIKIQRVKPHFYAAKLAVHFFSTQKLLGYLSAIGYETIAPLPRGFFLRAKAN